MISPSSVACEVADSARARLADASAVVVFCDIVVSGVVFWLVRCLFRVVVVCRSPFVVLLCTFVLVVGPLTFLGRPSGPL